jgi:purine-nucleoside phosphorylase
LEQVFGCGGDATVPEFLPAENCPPRLIFTDDPQRAKMMLAHHLENAVTIREQGDALLYVGGYKGVGLALIAVGFGPNAVLPYLPQAHKSGAVELIYIGQCLAATPAYALRSVILAEGGDAALLERARLAAPRYAISATPRALGGGSGLTDNASAAIYEGARACGLAALAILTVSENSATGARLEEHERRSRFYAASRLAFETLAANKL